MTETSPFLTLLTTDLCVIKRKKIVNNQKLVKMKNSVSFAIALAFSVIFFGSCRQVLGFECGKSIEIGRVELTDDTKSFFPYSINQHIVIKNSKGEELRLVPVQPAPSSIQTEYLFESARLCDNGFLDKQQVLYRTTYFHAQFQTVDNRKIRFDYSLSVSANGVNGSELGIADHVSVNSLADSTGIYSSVYTQFRGDSTKIPNLWRKSDFPIVRFVADTTIGGKNFKNVMTSSNNRHSVTIAKGKGLVAMKFDDELWLVERVE